MLDVYMSTFRQQNHLRSTRNANFTSTEYYYIMSTICDLVTDHIKTWCTFNASM